MRNIIINSLEKYIFTEDQLRGFLKRNDKDIDFESLTEAQLMGLAKKILQDSSHSELEQNSFDSPWRTPSDGNGKLLADDDSDPNMHIELIDTDQKANNLSKTIIDRLIKIQCKDCNFIFFVEAYVKDIKDLKCPVCQGSNNAIETYPKIDQMNG